jgi:hypothetical protein
MQEAIQEQGSMQRKGASNGGESDAVECRRGGVKFYYACF